MSSPAHPAIDLESYVNDLHRMLGSLRLAAYATDAMRVFMRLEMHSTHHPELENLIRHACPDWRNPGALYDPADAVTDVLAHLSSDMQKLIQTMESVLHSGIRPSSFDQNAA